MWLNLHRKPKTSKNTIGILVYYWSNLAIIKKPVTKKSLDNKPRDVHFSKIKINMKTKNCSDKSLDNIMIKLLTMIRKHDDKDKA